MSFLNKCERRVQTAGRVGGNYVPQPQLVIPAKAGHARLCVESIFIKPAPKPRQVRALRRFIYLHISFAVSCVALTMS